MYHMITLIENNIYFQLFCFFGLLKVIVDTFIHGELFIFRWIRENKLRQESLSHKKFMAYDEENNCFVSWTGVGNCPIKMTRFQRLIYKLSQIR